MKRIWNGYAAWCRKRGSAAACSPALMFLGILVVAATVIYVYREVIIHTLIIAGISIGIVCGTALLVSLTVNFLRWSRREQVRRVDALIAANPLTEDGEPLTVPETTDADARAISQEADWLANGVELAFGPDGELKAKKGN